MSRRVLALRTFIGRAVRPADRARKWAGWLGFAGVVSATGLGTVTKSWLLAAVVALVIFSLLLVFTGSTLVLEATAEDLPIEERVLALANEVRACDPREYDHPPFRWPSGYGLRQTVVEHLATAKHFESKARLRPYTAELHGRVVAVINELALAGHKDDQLRRFLNEASDEVDTSVVSLALAEQAKMLFIAKHQIEYKLGS